MRRALGATVAVASIAGTGAQLGALGGAGLGGAGLGGAGLGGAGLGGAGLGGLGAGMPMGGPPMPPTAPGAGGLGGGLGALGALAGAGSPLGGAGGPGLGAAPPLGAGSPLGGAGGLGGLGSLGGGGGGAPNALPTVNLLGGLGGGGGGLGGSQTPSNIQQMQAEAVRNPALDSLCPGKTRQSTDIGAECWVKIWAAGGCKAANAPQYEQWHQTQNLEVLVADVVQWAHLPDDRHKQGCYGDAGAPENLPAPPQPQAGAGGMGLGGGLGSMGTMGAPQGGGMGGGLGMGSPLGLGGGAGLQPPAQQGPPPPAEVVQKIESSLQTAESTGLCGGVGRQTAGVGEACWKQIWTHVGCLESTTPPYVEWHNTQSFEVLIADAAQWASLPSATHRTTCYGANAEL